LHVQVDVKIWPVEMMGLRSLYMKYPRNRGIAEPREILETEE